MNGAKTDERNYYAAPTVIRIVPYGKENEDWNEDDWEEEWNNAPDENEVDE